MWNQLRRRIVIVVFIAILNFIFGIYVITSVRPSNESQTRGTSLSTFQSNIEKASSSIRSIKSAYDYYFRIDYTINKGVCQPPHIFNTSETIDSIETLTNERINQILSNNIQINLQILRINPIIQKSEKRNKTKSLFKSRKSLCNYVLQLFVGLDFPSSCTDTCRSVEVSRLISDINLLDNSSLKFCVRESGSRESSIEYFIQNILLFRSVKYLEEIVYIQTIAQNRFISITILDSNAYQTSVSMSIKDKSSFIITKGLNCLDTSSVYLSFVSLSLPNLYLRHEDGRVKLEKNDQTILFRNDATFKLRTDYQRDLVAFQAINLEDYFYLALDEETYTSLVIIKLKPNITIDKFDKRFLFKIIIKT